VDQDCDGIADSWEDQYSTVNGAHLPPDWDQEPGFDSTAPTGDGFSVYDEYRGFHYVTDDDSTVAWSDTDPVGKQDVFFLDLIGTQTCGAAGLQPNCLTSALRSILAPQTSSFVVYRRVNSDQSGHTHAHDRLGLLNFNSPYATAQFRGYALFYEDHRLGAACNATPPKGGPVGNAITFTNDGTATQIDFSQLGACAALKQFPASVYLAQIVAHETGHKFNLHHPLRPGPILPLDQPANVQSLSLQQYSVAERRDNQLFVRLDRYDYLGGTEISDDVLPLGALAGNSITGKTEVPPKGLANCLGLPDCIYRVTTRNALAGPATNLLIEDQLQHIMDWTPRWTLQGYRRVDVLSWPAR